MGRPEVSRAVRWEVQALRLAARYSKEALTILRQKEAQPLVATFPFLRTGSLSPLDKGKDRRQAPERAKTEAPKTPKKIPERTEAAMVPTQTPVRMEAAAVPTQTPGRREARVVGSIQPINQEAISSQSGPSATVSSSISDI